MSYTFNEINVFLLHVVSIYIHLCIRHRYKILLLHIAIVILERDMLLLFVTINDQYDHFQPVIYYMKFCADITYLE